MNENSKQLYRGQAEGFFQSRDPRMADEEKADDLKGTSAGKVYAGPDAVCRYRTLIVQGEQKEYGNP